MPKTESSTANRRADRPPPTRPGLVGDALNVGRGVLMGGADIIPGVSGGTIALILGIYQRLVAAISRVDRTLLAHVRQRQWGKAARHVDLRFLGALGAGIGAGIIGLSSLMNYLLTDPAMRPFTLAAFFGLILASSVLVAKMVDIRRLPDASAPILLAVVAAYFAYWLTGLKGGAADPTLPYVFFCGCVAICAMILPGISGSFILLLLGLYVHVTGIIRDFLHLNFSLDGAVTLLVFAGGCAIGLVAFSKVLRWLLARYEPQTMGVLCGFMIGSLRKVWPFQKDVTLDYLELAGLSQEKISAIRADPALLAEVDMKHRIFENTRPAELSGDVWLAIAVAVVAAALVFLLDWLTGAHEHVEELTPDDGAT